MIARLELLSNEIILDIFSHLSWFDMITSLWSINTRFNSLVCSSLSIINDELDSGLTTHGLSYTTYCSTFPILLNSSSLCSSIRCIHLDGRNSSADGFCYEWLFNDNNLLNFPNLQSLVLTRCRSIRSIVQSLLYLIEHQLDNLTLTFDDNVLQDMLYQRMSLVVVSDTDIFEKQMIMFKEFVYKLFSNKCQLKTLQLDISSDCSDGTLHQCLSPNSCLSELIEYQHPFYCLTLRHLYIRLNQTRFLENLIEHTPNLEQIVVEFSCSLGSFASWKSNIEALKQSKTNWFNKIPKLRLFSLKSFMEDDLDFIYLKWLLNNVNYIETLRLHIEQDNLNESTCQNIWKSWIDANFIHKYCLPDIIPNLIDFTFYICKECQLSSNEMKNIKNSFKIHPLFIEHQWTNVECLFDSIMSCQHLFCSSNSSINYSNIFNWTGCNDLWYNKHPSIAFLLDKSVQLSFKIPYTKIHKDVCDNDKFDLVVSLSVLSRMRKNKIIANPFRNVTKIQFGTPCNQQYVRTEKSNKLDEIRARVLAHLISMTVQLKYLIIEKFEWLLHIIQYAFTDVRMNALRTVQHVEFHCHSINKNVASMGNQLVRIVSLWMPYLQTLRICRPDDFPWTSHNSYLHSSARLKRLKSSETSKSIARHVIVFRHDLSQLVKSLNELTYLDISGKITGEIVEPYRQMAQTLFPHSRVDVEILRFRLWL